MIFSSDEFNIQFYLFIPLALAMEILLPHAIGRFHLFATHCGFILYVLYRFRNIYINVDTAYVIT